MTAAPATIWGAQMTNLTGNTGGATQTLVNSYKNSKERVFIEDYTMAGTEVSTTVIGVARIPLFATLLGITVLTSVTLGSSTLAFGDAGSGNSAIYGAATTLTATNTPTTWAAYGTYGQQITSGYDSISGAQVTPQAPGEGGALYEDITMTIGAATLPAGTLRILTRYMID